jgi:adenylate cyclase 10
MKHQVFIQSLIKYIPTLVIKYIMQSPNIYNRTLPEVQKLNTVVLFADISGFTSISEAFAKQGSRGCEQLVFCINRYMELIVKRISKHGGDIIKFVGDALIVLWPSEENETLDSLATKAIQCALEIQDELNNKKIVENASALSVKVSHSQ